MSDAVPHDSLDRRAAATDHASTIHDAATETSTELSRDGSHEAADATNFASSIVNEPSGSVGLNHHTATPHAAPTAAARTECTAHDLTISSSGSGLTAGPRDTSPETSAMEHAPSQAAVPTPRALDSGEVPCLPNGQVIDGKNTLQSHSVAAVATESESSEFAAALASSTVNFHSDHARDASTLSDGDASALSKRAQGVTSRMTSMDVKNGPRDFMLDGSDVEKQDGTAIESSSAVTVSDAAVAVTVLDAVQAAVEDQMVAADPIYDGDGRPAMVLPMLAVHGMAAHVRLATEPMPQSRWVRWIVIGMVSLLLVAATVVGGVCGSGRCRRQSNVLEREVTAYITSISLLGPDFKSSDEWLVHWS